MGKILLIIPPYADIYGKINVKKMGFILPSLGIAYIASFLKSRGKEVELIDANCIDNINFLFEKIKKEQPEIIGFNVVTANMSSVVKMAIEIKKINPAIKVVVGGPHPSALPLETIKYQPIDIVVVGEGEFTVLELCEYKDLSNIDGICYKDKDGTVRINRPRALIEDLDSLPFPLFEQLPVYKYGYISLGNALPVLSGRGCPYNCTFCASGVINQRRCRFRNPKNFVDEIVHWMKCFKINKFLFCDESFTVNSRRTVDICSEIIERRINIRWSCMIRVDNTEEETLKMMKKAGCQMIEIGVESADEEVLEKCNKRINLKQVLDTVRYANKIKLEVNAFFILGLPYDTPKSITKTINFSKKLKIDYAQFSMFTPLPGSEAWDIVKKSNVLHCTASDWSDFSRYKKPIVTSDAVSNEKLYSLYNKAVRDFYFRPYTIFRTLKKVNSFQRLKNVWNAGLCLLNTLKESKS